MQVVSSTGSTQLTAAISSTGATAVSVVSGVNLATGVVIQIDTELMQITAVSGLNLTVTRGYNGTSAATHANNATVTIMAGIWIGPLLNSTTALPATSTAVTYAQIRVDGAALTGGGTAVTTDSQWGEAILFLALSAGSHRVTVEATGCLPWCEPAIYVGPVGAQALSNAGLALQVPGNVTATNSGTQITTNLPAALGTPTLIGQVLKFSSGVLNGQSFEVSSYLTAGSYLKLSIFNQFPTNPSAGDGFVLSNVATANSMQTGFNQLPTIDQIIDQGTNGGDASPILTSNGVVVPAADTVQAAAAAALTAAGLAPVATLTVSSNTGSTTSFNATGIAPFWTGPIIGLSGGNQGTAGNITANLPGSGSSRILTVSGLSVAPVSGDTFVAINQATAKSVAAAIPTPTVVNITDQSEVDIDNHHHHRT